MLFEHIDLLDENCVVRKDCFVATEGARITYLGADAPTGDYGETYDGHGKLLAPGMYNTHAHAPMVLLRGFAENLPLQAWLSERCWPFEAKLTDKNIQPAFELAIAEMLRFGTVSFSDMYAYTDPKAEILHRTGMKANLADGIVVFDNSHYEGSALKKRNEHAISSYHGCDDGRVLIDLCVHAEYSSNPAFVREVGEHAAERGVRTEIHLSETKLEHEECKERNAGMTPAEYFDANDFFRQPCTAAHCVWLEDDDIALLAAHGVTASITPASEMKLASGFAPITKLHDAGVNVALGTDGCASNNNHNLFKEMYLLATVYKAVEEGPTAISPKQALFCATRNGALAQGRDDCGSIKVGNRADLIVMDVDVPWMYPVHDQTSNLVFAAQGSDCVLTMVDGQVLYRDGTYPTIDVERAQYETQKVADEIRAQL